MATLPEVPEIAEFPLRSENRANYVELFEAFGASMPPFRAGLLEWGNYVIALARSGGFGNIFLGDDLGTANNYIFTPETPVKEHKLGRIYSFFAANDATGDCNLTINELPALPIKNPDGSLNVKIKSGELTKVIDMVTHYILLKSDGGGGMADDTAILIENGNENTLLLPSSVSIEDHVSIKAFAVNANTDVVTINGVPLSTTKDVTTNLSVGQLSGDVEIVPIGSVPERFWIKSGGAKARLSISSPQTLSTSYSFFKILFDTVNESIEGLSLAANGDIQLPNGDWVLLLKYHVATDYNRFRLYKNGVEITSERRPGVAGNTGNEGDYPYDTPLKTISFNVTGIQPTDVLHIEIRSNYGNRSLDIAELTAVRI